MACEGTDPLRMSHWTFLPYDFSHISVLSCLVTTIRGFVFLVFSSTDFCFFYSVCVFLVFFSGQNGRFWISEKYSSSNQKFRILEYSYPPFCHNFTVNVFNVSFRSRRRVRLCQSGVMAHINYSFQKSCEIC